MNPLTFLQHLKEVAASPFAFVAYICVVAAWVYVVSARNRLRTIEKTLKQLPPEMRADVLLREYATTPRKGLSAEQWIRSRKQTLLFAAFLATLIAGVAITIPALSRSTGQRREARLSLVDVSVNRSEEYPIVEFKVRNNTDEVVFIKTAEFKTLNHWNLPKPGTFPNAVPNSWTYDVNIPTNVGETTSRNVSQAISPNSVDRFSFRIGSEDKPYPFIGLFAYLFKIKLIYNEDNKALESPSILVHIPPRMLAAMASTVPGDVAGYQRNKVLAQEILKNVDKDTVFEDGILAAVNSWANADLSKLPKPSPTTTPE